MTQSVIGYVGMTHLGLNSAAAAAQKGFTTVCVDPDPALVARLSRGDLPVTEPGLDDCMAANTGRISFSSDFGTLAACDVVYVAPDVPTDDSGASDLTGIEPLLRDALAHTGPAAAVVILSQVPPGFTRARMVEGRTICYQVETLIFGRALERALLPERFIVGLADPDAPLTAAYAQFLECFGCPILKMRYESAELAKISINCFLVASVSTTNTLAALCEGIGAHWTDIEAALRLDKRIGQHAYLTPGLGIAGGNLERDLATVIRLARGIGSDAGVIEAYVANSHQRKDWALKVLHERVLAGGKDPLIAILGLAYKKNTHSIKNSPSVALIGNLGPYRLAAYDPIVRTTAVTHPRLVPANDALAACNGAAALVIMTPWPQFRELAPDAIAARLAGNVVVDPYGVLDGKACHQAGLEYHTLGRPAALAPQGKDIGNG